MQQLMALFTFESFLSADDSVSSYQPLPSVRNSWY